MGATTDLLTENGKNNKGKKYRTTPFKKKVVKYLSIEPPLNARLKKASEITGYSESSLMAMALIEYFDRLDI